jgi:hypothetical protein
MREDLPLTSILIVCLLVFFVGFVGCASHQAVGNLTRQKNADEILTILSRKYPNRVTVADATTFMTEEGFECTFEKSESFNERLVKPDGSLTKAQHSDIDFFRCVRRRQSGMVSSVFEVALVVEDGKVVRAIESTTHTGP